MLEIRTLGDLSICENGFPIQDLGLRKAEALLIYLAVEGGRYKRAVLAAMLWPESAQDQAQTSLRVVLSVLRKSLGAYMDISRHSVGLNPETQLFIDALDLEVKIADGLYQEAVELYRGDFLGGLHLRSSQGFENWRLWEQEHLRALFVRALHHLVSCAMEKGAYQEANDLAQRLLAIDPLDELAHRQAMLALALDGQRSAALIQYGACGQVLLEELGVEPSKRTQRLYQQIAQEQQPTGSPVLRPRHNLPTRLTSFVGREDELAQILGRIRDPSCRLITILGPGGIGKTRLALQVARAALASFSDGVYFIPLDTVSSPEYIVPAVAEVVGFSFDTIATNLDPKDQLLDYLENRSMLLVMDGFEHLIDHTELLAEVLRHAPDLKMLLTSRERVNLEGEWIFALEGLRIPQGSTLEGGDGASALRLFEERARQATAGDRLAGSERAHAIRICRLVEGMPLAIELAAAWTSTLSCEEIAGEIEKNIDILATSMYDVPEKHRSLRAVFDHSWRLLSEDQQDIFRRLSVFRGGFDPEAAKRLAGAELPHLSDLMSKSLLRRNAAGRFELLSLIKKFAREKLSEIPGESEKLHDLHCRIYMDLLAQHGGDMIGPRLAEAREAIRQEMGNVRDAMRWAVVHWDQEAARQALSAFFFFFIVQGWHEGIEALEGLGRVMLEKQAGGSASKALKDPVYLSARVHQAFFCSNLSLIGESEAISQECLPYLHAPGMEIELSICLHNLGVNAAFRGEYQEAIQRLEEAIVLGERSRYVAWPTYFLWLGHTYFLLGEYERGMDSFRECYQHFDEMESDWGKAFALSKMGLAADGLGEYSQAREYHQRALRIFERSGDRVGEAYTLSRISISAYGLEEYEEAVRLGREGYEIFQEVGHRWGICASLCRIGFGLVGLGDSAKARERFYKALERSRGDKMVPLSLYALAGLASSIAREGEGERALELFAFVQRHPQSPALYIDLAARWFEEGDGISSPDGLTPAALVDNAEALDEIVDTLLREREA